MNISQSSTPRCGSGPKCCLETPPPTPLRPRTPPPPPAWAAPSRSLAKRAKGWGEKGRRGRGGKGFWFEGRVLQLQWGMGGTLQTPVGARPTSGGSHHSRRPFLYIGCCTVVVVVLPHQDVGALPAGVRAWHRAHYSVRGAMWSGRHGHC